MVERINFYKFLSLLQKANKPLKRLKESQPSLANPRLKSWVNNNLDNW